MTRLNIGCGRNYIPGWINTDISHEVKAEHYFDIGKDAIPLDNNSVDEIYISGVLEQIGPNEELINALNECWRVLKPGGKMTVIVPNAKHAIAHRDPMDVRKFTKATFKYFDASYYEYRDYGSVYGFKPWVIESFKENDRHILTVTMLKYHDE